MIHGLSWRMSSYNIVQFIESSLTKLRGILTRLRFIKRRYEWEQEKWYTWNYFCINDMWISTLYSDCIHSLGSYRPPGWVWEVRSEGGDHEHRGCRGHHQYDRALNLFEVLSPNLVQRNTIRVSMAILSQYSPFFEVEESEKIVSGGIEESSDECRDCNHWTLDFKGSRASACVR